MTNNDKYEDLNNECDAINHNAIEDSEELNDEEIKQKGRPVGHKPKQAIFQLGNKARARFVEGNPNIFFEIKTNSEYEDEDCTYKNDGYFGEFYNLLQYSLFINQKSKLFAKSEVVCIEDMMSILKESKNESIKQAKEIIVAINNNSCVKEITEEAIDRCNIK